MRRLVIIPVLAALALLVASPAEAQRRMRTRVVSAPAGTQVITTSPSGMSSTSVPADVLNPGTLHDNTADRLLFGAYPVPGLGFDFVHQAATRHHAGVRALADPTLQQRLALARQVGNRAPVAVAPAFPVVVNSIQINVVPQPPVVIIQEPEPEPYERIERARYVEDVQRVQPVAPPPFYEPESNASELVFIRRDGSLLFAVAYTVRGGDASASAAQGARLIYITRDGYRRSVPLADLDLDASREMNEARGSSLQL